MRFEGEWEDFEDFWENFGIRVGPFGIGMLWTKKTNKIFKNRELTYSQNKNKS